MLPPKKSRRDGISVEIGCFRYWACRQVRNIKGTIAYLTARYIGDTIISTDMQSLTGQRDVEPV